MEMKGAEMREELIASAPAPVQRRVSIQSTRPSELHSQMVHIRREMSYDMLWMLSPLFRISDC